MTTFDRHMAGGLVAMLGVVAFSLIASAICFHREPVGRTLFAAQACWSTAAGFGIVAMWCALGWIHNRHPI
jgi:hypothetical protein